MNILRVTGSYLADIEFGGSVVADYETDKFLRAHGHNVGVISISKKSEIDHPVRYFRSILQGNHRFSISLFVHLIRAVKKYDLVIVTGIWDPVAMVSSFILALMRVRFVIIPHGSLNESTCFRNKKFFKQILLAMFVKFSVRRSTAVHFTNTFEYDSSVIKPSNHFIASFPLPLIDRPSKGSRHFGDALVVLFMGRITWKKGVNLLFTLIEKNEKDIFFQICGGDDEGLFDAWESRIKQKGLKLTNYQYHGFVGGAEKVNILAESDVYLLATANENFGIATYEALGSGVPVAITAYTAISKDIFQAEAGIKIELDVEDIHRKLNNLKENMDLLYPIQQNAKTLADRYRKESFSTTLIKEYEKCMI